MPLTYIGFKTEELDKVKDKCDGIYSADVTFQYSIVVSSKKNYSYLLMVKSDTADQAHKRGTWLVNNLGIDNDLYWVTK